MNDHFNQGSLNLLFKLPCFYINNKPWEFRTWSLLSWYVIEPYSVYLQ